MSSIIRRHDLQASIAFAAAFGANSIRMAPNGRIHKLCQIHGMLVEPKRRSVLCHFGRRGGPTENLIQSTDFAFSMDERSFVSQSINAGGAILCDGVLFNAQVVPFRAD
jgi:hypothetical protein